MLDSAQTLERLKKHHSGMKIQNRIASFLLALAAFLPLALPSTVVHAQAVAPRIDGFDVQAIKQLAPGNELAFTLYGSPGGVASVRIGGATGSLILDEVEAGVYEGIYTISKRDRLTKDSTATANLRSGNQVASSVLDESLLAGAPARWPGGPAAANGGPRIDRFNVDPANRLVPGAELVFTLAGSPEGTASVRINGVKGKISLEEIRPGVYEGAYTVKNRDKIVPRTVVTGNLRLGKQERSKVLGQALADNAAASRPRVSARPTAPTGAVGAPVCANCGVVEAINVVETKGNGSYLGMIGGGVVGALLGSQVGHGKGTTIAEVAGAAGGAWAGNEIEKRVKTTKHYEVVVRLQNGGVQTVSYPSQPAFAVGSRVRVENGTLVAA
jgi:outer membrane lipoprotein SlyB